MVNLYSGVPAPLRPHLREREFRALLEDRTKRFVGRQYLLEQLQGHLADGLFRSGYVVVSGEPGIGKTALMAHLVVEHGFLHHFNLASANISSPEAFLGNLCAQVITRYGLEVQHLPDHALRDSGFLLGLLDEAAENSTRPVVVVLDALDEADPAPVETGANRLYLPPLLPDGVYVIATARAAEARDLYVEQRRDVFIDDRDPRNLDDLRSFALAFFEEHADRMAPVLARWKTTAPDAVSSLVERSEGNFQYLRLVLDDLLADGGAEHHGRPDKLPKGLKRYYERHWHAMRSVDQDVYEQRQRPVLCYLATARQPVSVDELAQWSGIAPREVAVVVSAWSQFLNVGPGPQGGPVYSVYHRSFADFLAEEEGLEAFHDRIATLALEQVLGEDP